MDITAWLDGVVGRMKWYDISLVKMTVLFATLFLMTAWTGFRNLVLRFDWYWYLIITIILMIPILKKMFWPR